MKLSIILFLPSAHDLLFLRGGLWSNRFLLFLRVIVLGVERRAIVLALSLLLTESLFNRLIIRVILDMTLASSDKSKRWAHSGLDKLPRDTESASSKSQAGTL